MVSYFQKRPHLLILGLILLIGLFFRTFQIVERFDFAHDGDLYSWIVRDILINHHPRLIGQLTSAPGIFIGPFFYYLLVPFFILTNMDPVGVLIPTTIIGLLTIFSFYFVFSKLFNKDTGTIASFLYAVLIVTINSDRMVVPTITTSLWSVWYFYTIVLLTRGSFSILPILGILIGLIWHVHIALIPTLLAIPFAFLIPKKLPSLKQLLICIIALLIASSPLIFFELRHNFSQTLSFINNFTLPQNGQPTDFYKFKLVTEMVTKNLNALLFSPQSFNIANNIFFTLLILLLPILAKATKSLKELIPLYAWILGVVLFFSISKSPISEYYFSNLNVIFIGFVSLFFANILKKNQVFLKIVMLLLFFIAFKNAVFYTKDIYHKGYLEKKAVVNSIKKDSTNKGYPCFGISYITSPGENVGFRYLFYINNINLTHPSLKVPVYNIIIPDELAKNEIDQKFGHIGLILPKGNFSKENLESTCALNNTNLTDSLFGYVE